MLLRRRTPTRHRAAAAVELAVLLPFIVYIAVIGVDWARLFYYTIAIEQCARTGAKWAADPTTQGESGYATLSDAVASSAPNLNATLTASSQNITVDSRPGVKVTVTMTFKTITNFPGVPHTNTLTRSVSMRNVPVAPN